MIGLIIILAQNSLIKKGEIVLYIFAGVGDIEFATILFSSLSLLIIIAIPVIIVLSVLRKRNNKINRIEEKLDQLIAKQKDDHSH